MEGWVFPSGIVLLLHWTYILCSDSYWSEIVGLRNFVPDSNFTARKAQTLMTCIGYCHGMESCSAVAYTSDTLTCTPIGSLRGKQYQASSSVWGGPKLDELCSGVFSLDKTVGACLYFIGAVVLDNSAAKLQCESLGSRLAVLDNYQKFLAVRAAIRSSSYWLGGYLDSGIWKWSTGEVVNMSWFHPGQPSGGPATCMTLWESVGFDDLQCTVETRSLCEIF